MTLGTFAPAMAALGCTLLAARSLAALASGRAAGTERSAILTSLFAALVTPVLLWLMLNRVTDAGTLELF